MQVTIDIDISPLGDALPEDCDWRDYSDKDLEAIWAKLPDQLKAIAYSYGTNDTEFRDSALRE